MLDQHLSVLRYVCAYFLSRTNGLPVQEIVEIFIVRHIVNQNTHLKTTALLHICDAFKIFSLLKFASFKLKLNKI